MPEVTTRPHLDFDRLMRDFSVVGAIALVTWAATGLLGLASHSPELAPGSTLRFLLAALVLAFARAVYRMVRELQWRRVPTDERLGFSNTVVVPEAAPEAAPAPDHATTGSPQG